MRYVRAQSVDLSASCGRTCLAIRALRTALVATRAGVLAEVGLEVPVLCEPQDGAMPEQAGSLRRHRGSRYRVNPGPEGPPAGAFGLCEPAKAGLSSSYDFTSRPDGLARVVA
jgi:hypothetical protein